MLSRSRLTLSQFVSQRSLWLAAGLSLVGYWLARFWFPLRPFFNRVPLSDIRTFAPSLLLGLAYAVWLGALYWLYWLAYRFVRQRPVSLGLIVGTAVLFAIPLLQTYPINANDAYRYVIRGRISSVYDLNPFAVPPNAIGDDPFLPLAGEWSGATSPYGPVWELTAAAITTISGDDLHLGLVLFKGLGLAAHLAIAALIWQSLAERQAGQRAARALLWAWNPALLLMFVVDAHNDVLMLFWLLLGWLLARRGRLTIGFVVMLLAPLTKPIGLLPLPFFFLAFWRQQSGKHARWRFLLLSVAGGATAVILAFLPFGSPLDLLQRLQSEASSGAGFSIGALLWLTAQFTGLRLTAAHLDGLAALSVGALALWFVWLLRQAWRKRPSLRNAADIFFAYIITALNFRLWYTTWLFPWLLLDTREEYNENPHSQFIIHHSLIRIRAGVWLLLTTQLSVLIYGHLRVFVLGGDFFLAHLIGVPFTFFLPFVLARKKPVGKVKPGR
ncbi:MAG: hypothetical protein GY803_13345 [Chloroflexi bacterium]|nr:hypothetical protein [Chloroflexota bacterium]